MKTTKFFRTIATLLMVLAVTAITASAAEYTDSSEIEHKEAVSGCSELGIVDGRPDGSFAPSEGVTREQMTKMVIIASGNNGPVDDVATGTIFSDVPQTRWSCGFIEFAANSGIVSGMGNGRFAPIQPVTGVQAAKMLLVSVLGESGTSYSGSSWDKTVNLDAYTYGLYDGLEGIDVKQPLSREDAVQIVWNAVSA